MHVESLVPKSGMHVESLVPCFSTLPVFQRATLKNWDGPGNEASMRIIV